MLNHTPTQPEIQHFKSMLPNNSKYSLHAIEEIKLQIQGVAGDNFYKYPRPLFSSFYRDGVESLGYEIVFAVVGRLIYTAVYLIDLGYSLYKSLHYLGLAFLNLFVDMQISKIEGENLLSALANIVNDVLSLGIHLTYIPIELTTRTIATIIPLQKIYESCSRPTFFSSCFLTEDKEDYDQVKDLKNLPV